MANECELRKCVDCTFLRLREAKTGQLVSADVAYRGNGTIPKAAGASAYNLYDDTPLCAGGVDMQERANGKKGYAIAIAKLPCEEFVEEINGLCTNEVLKMKFMDEVDKRISDQASKNFWVSVAGAVFAFLSAAAAWYANWQG
ncbi:MAG: hypothetical protein WBD31_31025 [Rubripirellula sp.]